MVWNPAILKVSLWDIQTYPCTLRPHLTYHLGHQNLSFSLIATPSATTSTLVRLPSANTLRSHISWMLGGFVEVLLIWHEVSQKKTTRADACGTISPSQKCGIKLNEIQNNFCFFGLRSRPKLKPKPRGTYHIGLEKVCCSERGALGFTWYRRRLKFIS